MSEGVTAQRTLLYSTSEVMSGTDGRQAIRMLVPKPDGDGDSLLYCMPGHDDTPPFACWERDLVALKLWDGRPLEDMDEANTSLEEKLSSLVFDLGEYVDAAPPGREREDAECAVRLAEGLLHSAMRLDKSAASVLRVSDSMEDAVRALLKLEKSGSAEDGMVRSTVAKQACFGNYMQECKMCGDAEACKAEELKSQERQKARHARKMQKKGVCPRPPKDAPMCWGALFGKRHVCDGCVWQESCKSDFEGPDLPSCHGIYNGYLNDDCRNGCSLRESCKKACGDSDGLLDDIPF